MFMGSGSQVNFEFQDPRLLAEQLESLHETDLYNIARAQESIQQAGGNYKGNDQKSISALLNDRLAHFAGIFKKNNDDESLYKISDDLKNDPRLNSVTLNVLIEQSIADYFLSNKDSDLVLLSLKELDDLKAEISELEQEKVHLFDVNQSTNLPLIQEIDLKISKLNQSLNNHYFVSSQLGYIQDVLETANATHNITSSKLNKRRSQILNRSATSSASSTSDPSQNFNVSSNIERSLEDLVSQVMSLSVKHNVTLVEPKVDTMYTLDGRIDWVSSCIESLVKGSSHHDAPAELEQDTREISSNDDKEKLIDELNTKLNDLQFAHNYLTRRFEDERAQYDKSLNKNRLKLQTLQESISKSNFEVSNQTSLLVKSQSKIIELEKQLNSKEREILDLNKENNLLKVDHLGMNTMISPRASYDGVSPPISGNGGLTTPTTPEMPKIQQGQQHIDTSPNKNKNLSVSILRMEFKKLVSKINEKHESQLEIERTERKRLENLLKMYESRSEQQS